MDLNSDYINYLHNKTSIKKSFQHILNLPFVKQQVPMFVGEFGDTCRKFNKDLLKMNLIDSECEGYLENIIREIEKTQSREYLDMLLKAYERYIKRMDDEDGDSLF